jgi:uncharacterized protein YybS (DUF2232 family)
MIKNLRQSLESPNQWLILATLGTTLSFSTLIFLEISPVLIFFTMIPMILSPCFLVVTTWRYGLKMGAAVTALSSICLLLLFHLPVFLLFLAQFAAIGIILGQGLRFRIPLIHLLFTASFVSTLLTLAVGALFLAHAPGTPAEMIQQGSEAARLAFEENAQRFQLDPEELMEYQKSVDTLTGFIKVSFPALLFINAFSIVYLNLLVPLALAGSLGLDRSHVPHLKDISIPFTWVWGLIVSGLLFLLNVPYLKWVGLNLTIIFLLAYLMQGYGILSFYLNRTRLPRIVKGLIYLASVLSIPLIITICGVGLFDTWFNFRKRASARGR